MYISTESKQILSLIKIPVTISISTNALSERN